MRNQSDKGRLPSRLKQKADSKVRDGDSQSMKVMISEDPDGSAGE